MYSKSRLDLSGWRGRQPPCGTARRTSCGADLRTHLFSKSPRLWSETKLETFFVGTYAPPFRPLSPEEDADVKQQINASHADFVWVGLGGPKQEFWILAHQKELNVPFLLGVGAAFDFHSGRRPWAPPFIRKIGMEWLWRACSGGKKTFFRNLRCVSTVAFHLARVWIRQKIQIGKNKTSALSQKQ